MDNRSYYDDYAGWYERERGHGYHRMLDELETEFVRKHLGSSSGGGGGGGGGDVLEVGCGTGLILARVAQFANRATGVDLSAGMLELAGNRGLSVVQGSATALPFADEQFDCTYSFKVLPHVIDIRKALDEMARVTRSGGTVLAEFYNPHSLRYWVKKLKRPTAVSESTDDHAVFTRYDSITDIRSYLPANLEWVGQRGVRIVTPTSYVHNITGLGALIRWTEGALADHPLSSRFGGFLIAALRKR